MRLNFRYGYEFASRNLRANRVSGEGQHLGLRGVAAERKRLHETPRAIAPVGVIDAQRIAGEGEFGHADAALETRPYSGAPKNLVGAGADSVARGQILEDAAIPRRLHMIAVQAIEFGVQIGSQEAFLRAQLHGIR